MTTINVRIEKKTKIAASKALASMGLDLSTGVKLFLHQVVTEQALPFTPRTENGFTREHEKRIVKETKDALKHGNVYKNAHDALKDL